MPIEMSPSLRLTFDPPKALRRDEVGKLMNEKTDLPALDTCACATLIESVIQAIKTNMYLFLLKSGTKVQKNFEICKKSSKFVPDFETNTKILRIINQIKQSLCG